MSGGSMEYLYEKVESAQFSESTHIRRAFRAHLNLVAKALRAIEWNDSGDGDDQEDDLLKEILGPGRILEQATRDAEVAFLTLRAALNFVKGEKP